MTRNLLLTLAAIGLGLLVSLPARAADDVAGAPQSKAVASPFKLPTYQKSQPVQTEQVGWRHRAYYGAYYGAPYGAYYAPRAYTYGYRPYAYGAYYAPYTAYYPAYPAYPAYYPPAYGGYYGGPAVYGGGYYHW